jgi:hypothetical protein
MAAEASDLERQVSIARKRRMDTARAVPWLFREYTELVRAKAAFVEAQRRYEQAQKDWDECLGNDR